MTTTIHRHGGSPSPAKMPLLEATASSREGRPAAAPHIPEPHSILFTAPISSMSAKPAMPRNCALSLQPHPLPSCLQSERAPVLVVIASALIGGTCLSLRLFLPGVIGLTVGAGAALLGVGVTALLIACVALAALVWRRPEATPASEHPLSPLEAEIVEPSLHAEPPEDDDAAREASSPPLSANESVSVSVSPEPIAEPPPPPAVAAALSVPSQSAWQRPASVTVLSPAPPALRHQLPASHDIETYINALLRRRDKPAHRTTFVPRENATQEHCDAQVMMEAASQLDAQRPLSYRNAQPLARALQSLSQDLRAPFTNFITSLGFTALDTDDASVALCCVIASQPPAMWDVISQTMWITSGGLSRDDAERAKLLATLLQVLRKRTPEDARFSAFAARLQTPPEAPFEDYLRCFGRFASQPTDWSSLPVGLQEAWTVPELPADQLVPDDYHLVEAPLDERRIENSDLLLPDEDILPVLSDLDDVLTKLNEPLVTNEAAIVSIIRRDEKRFNSLAAKLTQQAMVHCSRRPAYRIRLLESLRVNWQNISTFAVNSLLNIQFQDEYWLSSAIKQLSRSVQPLQTAELILRREVEIISLSAGVPLPPLARNTDIRKAIQGLSRELVALGTAMRAAPMVDLRVSVIPSVSRTKGQSSVVQTQISEILSLQASNLRVAAAQNVLAALQSGDAQALDDAWFYLNGFGSRSKS